MSSDVTVRPLRLAVEGCGHGTLHSIYASIEASCKLKGWPSVDLVIIGGDFQSVRNPHDLNCMSVPVKYRELGDFHEYYSRKRTAPYLTLFVGGNHEASNYLHELYYGGWVAPNIYYLGAANVLRLGGLRIAGLSGIWKGFDYRKPHHERLPYNEDQVKSAYHVRELDVRKLLQIRSQVDIGLSHDWPKGVEWMGDSAWLFRKKSHFKEDADSGRLGSVAARYVLDRLRPTYWFSAHLHIKYAATVHHAFVETTGTNERNVAAASAESTDSAPASGDSSSAPVPQPLERPTNEDEIDLDLDEADTDGHAVYTTDQSGNGIKSEESPSHSASAIPDDVRAQLPASFSKPSRPSPPATLPFPPEISNLRTEFLALDKCLPHRDFLQLLEVARPPSTLDTDSELTLAYDEEWLAITRALHLAHDDPPYLTLGATKAQCPPDRGDAFYRRLIDDARLWLRGNLPDSAAIPVPLDFEPTAPTYQPGVDRDWRVVREQPREYGNPQTQAYCDMLGIANAFAITDSEALANQARGPRPADQGARGGGRGGYRGGGDSHGFGRGRGRGRGRGYGRGHTRGGRY